MKYGCLGNAPFTNCHVRVVKREAPQTHAQYKTTPPTTGLEGVLQFLEMLSIYGTI